MRKNIYFILSNRNLSFRFSFRRRFGILSVMKFDEDSDEIPHRKQWKREKCERTTIPVMAKKWNISKRRVRQLCKSGSIFAAKKIDGEWTIPVSADRPVDGRRYRYQDLPSHHLDFLRLADAAVIKAKEMLRSDRDATINGVDPLDFFIQGSAHHLHKTTHSTLTFEEVRQVLTGLAVAGKPLRDQIAVLNHKRAIVHLIKELRRRRRLCMPFLLEVHSMLVCGRPSAKLPYSEDLPAIVKKAMRSKAAPIVTAATFLAEFMAMQPLKEENERTAYMMVNCILMTSGYPPILIYRAMIREYHRFWKQRDMMIEEDRLDEFPPRESPGFFIKAIACAVRHSCKIGLIKALP